MTTFDGKTINFDPSDRKGMCELMKRADEFKEMCFGKNTEGEDVTISVNKDNIIVATSQHNGYIRTNIYYDDGLSEEMYEYGGLNA